jgi:cell division protease FtsH
MDRVLMGDTKPAIGTDTPLGVAISRALAVHEAGRAILAVTLRQETGLVDDIEKLSIVRRGQSYTRIVYARGQDEDYLVVTRKQMLAQLRLAVAGHAAEEVLGLDATTFSADDFAQAGVRCGFCVRLWRCTLRALPAMQAGMMTSTGH